MINLNTIGSGAATITVGNNVQGNISTAEEVKAAVTHSTVVDIQGRSFEAADVSEAKLDRSGAKAMAFDIASLLGSRGMAAQANLNSFDAARLLAD